MALLTRSLNAGILRYLGGLGSDKREGLTFPKSSAFLGDPERHKHAKFFFNIWGITNSTVHIPGIIEKN